jgi:hypothetical protein
MCYSQIGEQFISFWAWSGTGEYGDLIDAGILDPAKVTRLQQVAQGR